MYNDNKYFHYIREYIMTTNISLIHESVFLLYEMMYNDNKYFFIHENVFLIIRDGIIIIIYYYIR